MIFRRFPSFKCIQTIKPSPRPRVSQSSRQPELTTRAFPSVLKRRGVARQIKCLTAYRLQLFLPIYENGIIFVYN